jgi:hypothetical protein
MIHMRSAGAKAVRAGRRLRWLLAGLIVAALLAAGAMLLPVEPVPVSAPAQVPPPSVAPPSATPQSVAPPSATPQSATPPSATPPFGNSPSVPPSVAPAPSAGATSATGPQDLLTLPGKVATHGTGKFTYATGRGKVLGRKRMQRVAGGDRASFTVYLVTRDTAGRMCRVGGVNVTVLGRPYTSCRSTGKAIINLDRWRLSARPYITAKVPLITYRQYVINHEVGHELGRHHEGCPKRGGPAPVMVQQTLTVRGCVPYAWPLRNGRRFEGPPIGR